MSWVVIETKSLQENLAQRGLNDQIRYGVVAETFLPTYMREIRHARHVEQRRLPLYPRYLFANVDLTTRRWTKILHTRGVMRVLGPDPNKPSVIHEKVLTVIGHFQSRREFSEGDRVMLRSWGVEALFGEYIGDRCRVMLSFMGKQVSWDTSLLDVEKVA